AKVRRIFVGSATMLRALANELAGTGMRPVIDKLFDFEDAPRRLPRAERHFPCWQDCHPDHLTMVTRQDRPSQAAKANVATWTSHLHQVGSSGSAPFDPPVMAGYATLSRRWGPRR